MSFKRIIVAVDGSKTSDTAFLEALNLTSSLNAKLCIVHMVDIFPIASLSMGADFDRCREIVKDDGQAVLDRMKLLAQINNITAETRLIELLDASKKISEKLSEIVLAWNADLVIMGTHGRRGVRRLILGSVAEEAIRTAPVPILLVRAQDEGEKQKKPMPYKHIVAAIDSSELAPLVLSTAVDITKALNASLTILHVANEFCGKNFIFARELIKYGETVKKLGLEILENAKRSHDMHMEIVLAEITDATGTVADKINETVAEQHADLIVIGTHGRKGFNRFLLGSVAEETARSSAVPLLLIREKNNGVSQNDETAQVKIF